MSSYHIAKDGKQAGPIDEETIRQQIAAGALNTSDLCWCEGMSDWQSIGTVFNFNQKAVAPPPLTNRTGATMSCPHQLTTFPVAGAVLLHYVTFGIFTLIWLNLMHGKMNRVRADDPSAGKAVGFCFIPFFNLFWIFFTYRRLCLRIDEQRDLYRLPPSNLRGLATTACIFQIMPYINFLLGYTIITPTFIGMMQSSVNQLVHTSATTVPRATLPVSSVPARGMS
ncbi:MAG: GYF domain-containing protein [Kiritimatiellae bacterium]|nr:GYF domain-containing protein [Kiritimatiellia bacterium]